MENFVLTAVVVIFNENNVILFGTDKVIAEGRISSIKRIVVDVGIIRSRVIAVDGSQEVGCGQAGESVVVIKISLDNGELITNQIIAGSRSFRTIVGDSNINCGLGVAFR